MKKKLISYILALVIIILLVLIKTTNANAGYSEEKQYSMQQCISYVKKAPMLSKMKLFHDGHGYYAVYNYNGRVECYLGKKNQKMRFSDFAKKLGAKTIRTVKKFTITKKERELKKLAVGALIAYVCTQAGCPWYAGYVMGVAGDKGVDALLRKPGKYRMTTITSLVRAYDCASRSYMESYSFCSVSKLEKYNSKTKNWTKVWSVLTPKFIV